MKRIALNLLRRHGRDRLPASGLLAKVAQFYLAAYDNENHNLLDNGERTILERLAPFRPRTIFDVGANVGDWSRCARSLHADATIHAFEIAPPTYAELVRNVGDLVVTHPFGLSEADGKVELEFFPEHRAVSTIIHGNDIHQDRRETIACDVRSGDGFCAENGIDAIDFLKIDTEGAEHLVLKGFRDRLSNASISVIQFEYGMANIYSRHLLKDYYAMLSDYHVGKVFPGGVEFKAYKPQDENFRSPNFLAVHKSRADLQEALSL